MSSNPATASASYWVAAASSAAVTRCETAEFSEFNGDLLARHTVVLDMLGLARQIGAVPKPGTVAERIGVWLQHVAARRARRGRA